MRHGCKAALYTIEDEVVSEFVVSKRGRRLLKYEGFTYYAASINGHKTRWRCSTNTHHKFEYVRSRRGKLMLKVNGYTYSSTPGVGLKKRWKCSTHQHLGCKGSVHTVNEQVLKVNETHDHPPQKR
ncbi:hypothetical protein KGM_208262 [Danaus plexippus plexippus]|uniref:FLYWCH-type domain-containing protein n=1 Tax=Danaus plexippus plexippus TaxID=278856 RepID=A0A212EXT1_DANPL|nr:hypothetical protein KGM_208262 [Danaus plexippus plexippus]